MSMAPGAPSVQSSSFSNYSSGPSPTSTGSSGIGTGDWFKEHALFILLGVIALVAILWYLSRRSGGTTLSPDAGYPLGYPSVGSGTSGGSGASSGGAGAADTGTAATQDATSALDAFVQGYKLRDGQVQSQGTTAAPTNSAPTNVYVSPNPVSPNVTDSYNTITNNDSHNSTTNNTQYTSQIRTTTASKPAEQAAAPVVLGGVTSQALNAARGNLSDSKINNILQSAFVQVGMTASTGTHAATTNTSKPKSTTKKPAHVTGGATHAPRAV